VTKLFPESSNRAIDIATIWEAKGCAPLVVCGRELHTVRQWVNAFAAIATDDGSGTHTSCSVQNSVRAA
jgi:hypothetical protein